ncbi:7-deoxyloganetin glucosyltransferase-like [Curcuma longa]|uniref:7-deoxyloganetin glucosyltransferase-like n=1 Tax=Curcuma longa TaxID=136217 RepID=UPI003D9F1EC2
MERSTKTHLVCVAPPFQGHINSMLHLAKVLHFKGFFITFVNTEYAHQQLLKHDGSLSAHAGLPDFRFASISDGLSPLDDSDEYREDARNIILANQKNCPASFLRLISALNDPSSGVPPVRCVISDSFASFTLDATTKLGIPNVFYCPVSVCGFTDFYYCKDLIERGLVPLKSEDDLANGYLDTIIDWIPGLITVRMRDLTSFMRTTDRDDVLLNYVMDGAHASSQGTAIIFNTFSELESPLLNACASMLPPVFDIGPMCLLSQYIPNDSSTSSIGGLNMWREDLRCMEWLDEKESGSVLYVNFGSTTNLTSKQALEFGWGLANSGCSFLWVIRPDLVVGDAALLPQEFSEMTKGRSFITSWCPQQRVLAHAAIGGFLTHCGWNSTTESICSGVPMICWPFFGDQQINCRYICSVWGIGTEIDQDVTREEVEGLVKELMEGQKGKEMKRKAVEWKEKVVEAAKPGGGSWRNLEKLIEEIIMKDY